MKPARKQLSLFDPIPAQPTSQTKDCDMRLDLNETECYWLRYALLTTVANRAQADSEAAKILLALLDRLDESTKDLKFKRKLGS
jgi:hypothetical protein